MAELKPSLDLDADSDSPANIWGCVINIGCGGMILVAVVVFMLLLFLDGPQVAELLSKFIDRL